MPVISVNETDVRRMHATVGSPELATVLSTSSSAMVSSSVFLVGPCVHVIFAHAQDEREEIAEEEQEEKHEV